MSQLALNILLWVMIICYAAAFLVITWHLLVPKSLKWLSERDQDRLKRFFAASLLIGIIGDILKRRFLPNTELDNLPERRELPQH